MKEGRQFQGTREKKGKSIHARKTSLSQGKKQSFL